MVIGRAFRSRFSALATGRNLGHPLNLAALVFVLGCKNATLPGETTSANEPSPSLWAAQAVEPSVSNASRETWKVAVAEQRWREAAGGFDLAHPHPTEPALRYVRARIAWEVAEYERVLDLLNGLEAIFPDFVTEIQRLRAQAQAEIGPHEDAARYFQTQTNAEDRLRAARAWLEAKQPSEALSVLTRSRPLFTGKSPSREAGWRALHAEVLTVLGRRMGAMDEYLWIAVQAPTSQYADDAVLRLEDGVPKRLLTKTERYQRMAALAQAGDLDGVMNEERALKQAPGPIPSTIGVQRHLAWAYYQSRRDYVKAASLFEECARKDSSQVASDLFYSARALSRAHQDKAAIVRYQELIRKQPSSKYAVTAKQLIGRLWFAQGDWPAAVAAYDGYLQKFGNSKHHRAAINQARHERAISLLALQDKRAASALKELLQRSNSPNHRAQLSQLLGVAYLQAGETESARQTFEEVIASRPLSFPALAAAARLRTMGKVVPQELLPATAEDAVSLPPLAIQLPRRAQQLMAVGLDSDAETELAAANGIIFDAYAPRSGEAACLTFGQLATAKQRYRKGQKVIRERAVQRVITPATRWAWDCLYPTPYVSTVLRAAARHAVEPSLVYAVMRQESAFDPVVASPAAAHGLMQIIEPTARSLAKELQLPYSKGDLLTPEYNIELGATYLQKLLRRYDGQVALAAAGYNAGPGAASRWLQTAPDLPLDLFVARIIYDETRNYVQRVVGNWARYRYLEGGLANIPQLSLTLPAHEPLAAEDY